MRCVLSCLVLCSAGLLLVAEGAIADTQGKQGVPTSFMGVELGEKIDVVANKMPVIPSVDVKGAESGIFGTGMSIYFKPKKVNSQLPYTERKKTPKDEYFATSHRAFFVPIPPSVLMKDEELDRLTTMTFEAILIEWQDPAQFKNAFSKDAKAKLKASNDNYFWAKTTCNGLQQEIAKSPVIRDVEAFTSNDPVYECSFFDADRVFKVSSALGRTISLSYLKEASDAKFKAMDDYLARVRGRNILSN